MILMIERAAFAAAHGEALPAARQDGGVQTRIGGTSADQSR